MSPCVYHCVAFTRNNACAEAWRGRKRRKSGRVMENSLSTTVRPTLRPRVSLPLSPSPFFLSPFGLEAAETRRAEQKPGPKSENIGNKVNFWKSISAIRIMQKINTLYLWNSIYLHRKKFVLRIFFFTLFFFFFNFRSTIHNASYRKFKKLEKQLNFLIIGIYYWERIIR